MSRAWLRTAILCALAAAPSLAAAGGRVVVSDDDHDPPTLDPFFEFSEKNHTIIQQVLEGLVRLGPGGDVEPALAESWERPTPLRLRFHLRRGVRFHDGEPLDAECVRFSIARYIDPAVGYPGRGFFTSIERAEAVDPHTVDIVTRYPDGALLRRLAGLITIVPRSYYEKVGEAGFSKHPIGTGPFEFDHWIDHQEISLRTNRSYWENGFPRIDELVFRFVPFDKQVDDLIAGDVDLVTEMPGTATLRIKKNPTTTVLKKATWHTVGATFNSARWPLCDVRFRRALNYAIDRSELIRYDLLGNGRFAATLSLPGEVGHNQELAPYPHDLRKARELLRQAGINPPMHLKTLVRVQGDRAAKILAKQFKDVGVVLDMETGAESNILGKLRTRDWDMAIAGMSDPTGDSSFIQSILLSSGSPYSLFKSTDYDRRLEGFIGTISAGEREERGRALDEYLYSESLSLFTYQRVQTYGINRKLRFTPSITGMPYFRTVEVIKGPPARTQEEVE